jgi:phenylpropionate dioxygenase-like ring-hydroxylating dioxygenase large terminal subunit
MPEEHSSLDPSALVNHEEGVVSASIFVEEEIYRQEMQQIFARCWLYIAHESQVAKPGDFTLARMGEDALIVCRGPGGTLHAFLNMCPSCTSLLQRADSGNTDVLTCQYHGWDFNLDGRVLAEDDIGNKLPTDELTLIEVPQVDSYKGMLFASFDENAPPLSKFLGDIRWGLDLLLDQGDMRIASVTRWSIETNWKFAAESSVNDIYHGHVHMAALHADNDADMERETRFDRDGFTVITEYGHGLNAEKMDDNLEDAEDLLQQWRQDPAKQRRLGQFRMGVARSVITLFPNAMLSPSTRELHLWHPRSVNETEVWMVTFRDENEPPEVARAFRKVTQLRHGPAGLYSQDEGENWEGATKGARGIVISQKPLNYQMGLGHGEIIEDEQSPPRIETLVNEHRQLWFYRNWVTAMKASDWDDWHAHLPKPTGTV